MKRESYLGRLRQHVHLCKSNLLSSRVKCCASCPFEDLICAEYPELRGHFRSKRQQINPHIIYPEA